MNPKNFFAELKRRNVYKVAVAYAVVAWLLIQTGSILFPTFEAPPWVMKVFVTAIISGFPVALIIAWAYELTPEGVKRTEEVAPHESITRRTGRKLDFLIIGVLLLVIAALVYQRLHPKSATVTSTVPDKSIAVLPFENLSSDKENAYFADGISEELLNALSKVPGLRVVARTSSFSFKGKNADVSEIARKLGVTNVLEGSLRRDGDRIRVTAQLIDARDSSHLWSATFERQLQGVFAVQDEITRAILEALKLKLGGTPTPAAGQNAAAYDFYLQGLFYYNKSDEASYRKALALFQQALEKDPTLARAWSGIAGSWINLADAYVPPLEGYPATRAAARKALEIDPRNAQALCYLAEANRVLDWDHQGADEQFRAAIRIDPNFSEAYLFLGTSLIGQGEREAGVAELRQAMKLDPLSAAIHHFVSGQLVRAGMLEEALQAAKRTNELDPTYLYEGSSLARIHLAKGELNEAIRLYEEGERITHQPSAALAVAYARSGRKADAERKLEELLQKARQRYYRANQIATVYAALGQTEAAFAWLERAYSEHSSALDSTVTRPEFRPMRGDPRFIDLLKRIGLDPAKVLAPLPNEQVAISPKSIAVLPFENRSDNKQNAYFTDGVQDEILTHLTRIADLKVISRTSVMQYKAGGVRNLRQIGQELGVAHLLEGSVQRAANKVRVNAQLIDARTDAHLWAQTYDRDLADVFAIQSEIAKVIADQLHAKISPSEKKAIEQPPTSDLVAFDLYTRAKNARYGDSFGLTNRRNLELAIDLLNQALARDPSFFLALCQLAAVHDTLYFFGLDHTPERLALAEAAVQAAVRLRPDAGEAHLARAEHLYRGYLDYPGALAELEIARRSLPNDPRVIELLGFVTRRQGKHEEGLHYLEQALELDPLNFFLLDVIYDSYQVLRRYPEATAILDRALALNPKDVEIQVTRGVLHLDWKADTRPLRQTIEEIRRRDPAVLARVADSVLRSALAERDGPAAEAALTAMGDHSFGADAVRFDREVAEGVVARMTGNEEKARAAFTVARERQEKIVQTQPEYGPAVCMLAVLDAFLGRKEDALRGGRRAVELLPVAKDSVNGAHMIAHLALIAAWVGEKNIACEQLTIATRMPGPLSYGQLKLLPLWDPLRGDPCFEKIVTSLAPKESAAPTK